MAAIRLVLVITMCLGVFLSTGSGARAEVIEARTFVSPSRAFQLKLPPNWTIERQGVTRDTEYLGLSNGITTVDLASRGGVASTSPSCLGSLERQLAASPLATWMVPLRDETGAVVAGGDDERRFIVFRFSPEPDNPVEELVAYLECRVLERQAGTLAIVAISPAFAFALEAPLVAMLLADLDLAAGGAASRSPA